MSVEDHQVSFSLQINVEDTLQEMRKLQTVVYRTLGLMRRTGLLPENIDEIIMKVQRAIALLNQMRLTALAVQMATGPLGWALAGVSFATMAMDAGDFMMDLG